MVGPDVLINCVRNSKNDRSPSSPDQATQRDVMASFRITFVGIMQRNGGRIIHGR